MTRNEFMQEALIQIAVALVGPYNSTYQGLIGVDEMKDKMCDEAMDIARRLNDRANDAGLYDDEEKD